MIIPHLGRLSSTACPIERVISSVVPQGTAPRGIFSVTTAAYFPLHHIGSLLRTASPEPVYQTGEFQQVCHAEECPLLAKNGLRIRGDEIRPLWRNRAHRFVVDFQQEARAGAVRPLAHTGELAPAERMKRMRDTNKPRRCDGNVRILDRGTSACRPGNSGTGRRGRRRRGGSWRRTPSRCSWRQETSRRLRGRRPGGGWRRPCRRESGDKTPPARDCSTQNAQLPLFTGRIPL